MSDESPTTMTRRGLLDAHARLRRSITGPPPTTHGARDILGAVGLHGEGDEIRVAGEGRRSP